MNEDPNVEQQTRKYSHLTVGNTKQIEDEMLITNDNQLPKLRNLMSQEEEYVQRISHVHSIQDFLLLNNLNDHQSQQFDQQQHTDLTIDRRVLVSQQNKRRRTAIKYNPDSEHSENSSQIQQIYCNCSKTHCLKLYCLCFHRNQPCGEKCKCCDCKNNASNHQDRVAALERVKKKAQRAPHDQDLFDTSKVWGCCCTKSKCRKNYCECYHRNQKCTSNCRCEECDNKRKPKPKTKKVKKN